MLPKKELLVKVSMDNRVLGSCSYVDAHSKKCVRHRTVHVMIFDGIDIMRSKVLLLKRRDGRWGSCGGHVRYNESSYQAMFREIYEELHITVPLRYRCSFVNDTSVNNKEVVDLFFCNYAVPVSDIRLNSENVEYMFIYYNNLAKFIEENECTETLKRVVDILHRSGDCDGEAF